MTLRYQGMNLATYMQIMGMDEAKFRDQYRESALRDVKTQLVIEKIAETEGLTQPLKSMTRSLKRWPNSTISPWRK